MTADARKMADPPFIRKKKLEMIHSMSEFLPHAKGGWYTKESYRLRLYHEYKINKEFRKALNDFKVYGKNKNEHITNLFKQVITNKENFILEIIGLRRCGKSRLARKLILLYCKMARCNVRFFMDCHDLNENRFFIIDPLFTKEIKVYVTYSFDESEEILRTVFTDDDIIFQDEMPKSHGAGTNIMRDKLDNILKIASGKKRINFLFLNPYMMELHEIDFYIKVLSVNKKQLKTIAMLSTKTDDNTGMIHDGVVTFDVVEPKVLTDYYEPVSEAVKTKVRNLGGSHVIATNLEPFIKLLEEELEKSSEDIKTKTQLRIFAERFEKIASFHKVGDVIETVYKKIKELKGQRKFKYGSVDKKQEDDANEEQEDDDDEGDNNMLKEQEVDNEEQVNGMLEEPKLKKKVTKAFSIEPVDHGYYPEFEINEDEILKAYPNNRDAVLYGFSQKHKGTLTQEDIADEFKITQPRVAQIMKEVRGWIADRFGHEYEVYLFNRYKVTMKDLLEDIKCEGVKGVNYPDLELWLKDGRVLVICVKCFRTKRAVISVPQKWMTPEIDRVLDLQSKRKDRKSSVIFHFNDPEMHKRVEKDVDMNALKLNYTVRLTERVK